MAYEERVRWPCHMPDDHELPTWNQALAPEAAQRRETFARFGLAVYQAQCVEQQLGILLATTLNPEFLRASAEVRERFFGSECGKTLGQMVASIRKRVAVSSALLARLERAVKVRNWLAHQYFFLRGLAILSSAGRDQMIEELQEAADFLGEVDTELTGITVKWLEFLGVSREDLNAQFRNHTQSDDA